MLVHVHVSRWHLSRTTVCVCAHAYAVFCIVVLYTCMQGSMTDVHTERVLSLHVPPYVLLMYIVVLCCMTSAVPFTPPPTGHSRPGSKPDFSALLLCYIHHVSSSGATCTLKRIS